jgi:sec-independent protein translocase protein TatA
MGLDNPLHIVFLLILLLLVFGAKRLPEMGKSLGSGMRGFKDALSGESTDTPVSTPAPVSSQPVLGAQPSLVAVHQEPLVLSPDIQLAPSSAPEKLPA